MRRGPHPCQRRLAERIRRGISGAPPDGPAVVARVNQLAAACRKVGVLVVHTAHVTRADGSNVGVMGEIIFPCARA